MLERRCEDPYSACRYSIMNGAAVQADAALRLWEKAKEEKSMSHRSRKEVGKEQQLQAPSKRRHIQYCRGSF